MQIIKNAGLLVRLRTARRLSACHRWGA